MEGASEAAAEAVRQAVGGGCRSGWGRLLSVTNAIETCIWRQGDSGGAKAGRPGGGGGITPPIRMHQRTADQPAPLWPVCLIILDSDLRPTSADDTLAAPTPFDKFAPGHVPVTPAYPPPSRVLERLGTSADPRGAPHWGKPSHIVVDLVRVAAASLPLWQVFSCGL